MQCLCGRASTAATDCAASELQAADTSKNGWYDLATDATDADPALGYTATATAINGQNQWQDTDMPHVLGEPGGRPLGARCRRRRQHGRMLALRQPVQVDPRPPGPDRLQGRLSGRRRELRVDPEIADRRELPAHEDERQPLTHPRHDARFLAQVLQALARPARVRLQALAAGAEAQLDPG